MHGRMMRRGTVSLTAVMLLLLTCACGEPPSAAEVRKFEPDSLRVTGELLQLAYEQGSALDHRRLEHIAMPLGSAVLRFRCTADSVGTRDQNGNGVPEDLTLTFQAARCRQDASIGSTITVEGSVRVQDLGGRWSARVTYTGFAVLNGGPPLGFITRNAVDGVVELRLVADSVVESDDRTRRTLTNDPQGTFRHRRFDLRTQYRVASRVPPPPSALVDIRGLELTGSVSRVLGDARGRDSLRFAISTPQRLEAPREFNPFCPYSVGVLRAVVSGSVTGTVMHTYAC